MHFLGNEEISGTTIIKGIFITLEYIFQSMNGLFYTIK